MPAWPYPRWIAHRGAGLLAPENTLAAFRLGAAHGYRMFECDVTLSADSVPFLLHDRTLERTTNGHGAASDHDWQHLSQLDAGSWHSPPHAGEPLPTLATIATACLANHWLLNIEIKPAPGLEARTGEVVAHAVRHLWGTQSPTRGTPLAIARGPGVPAEALASASEATTAPAPAPAPAPARYQTELNPPTQAPTLPLLTSFQPEALAAAQRVAPEVPRGLLLDNLWDGWQETAQRLACVAMVCHHRLWTAKVLGAVHGAGMRGLSYTVNDVPCRQRLLALGVDGLITDRVDEFEP